MTIVTSDKAELTLRFWKGSLAWKNIDDWARGWTTGDFIHEVRELCRDQGRLGLRADNLMNDVIHDRERVENEIPGELIKLPFVTQKIGQAINV